MRWRMARLAVTLPRDKLLLVNLRPRDGMKTVAERAGLYPLLARMRSVAAGASRRRLAQVESTRLREASRGRPYGAGFCTSPRAIRRPR
jgi:hypothetical protein